MTRDQRETIADALTALAGVVLLASLFLTWSHQFSPAFLAAWGGEARLQGVPRDPTAWEVYSSADVLLALLAAGLVGVALLGSRGARLCAAAGAAVAFAFTLHALGAPPSSGANIFDPALTVPSYFRHSLDRISRCLARYESRPGPAALLLGLTSSMTLTTPRSRYRSRIAM